MYVCTCSQEKHTTNMMFPPVIMKGELGRGRKVSCPLEVNNLCGKEILSKLTVEISTDIPFWRFVQS